MALLRILIIVASILVISTQSSATTGATSNSTTGRNCTEEQIKLIKTTSDDANKCYRQFVIGQINNTHSHTSCSTTVDLLAEFDKLKEGAKCLNRIFPVTFFLQLLEFSVKNNAFRDFLNEDGVGCLSKNHAEVTGCITKGIGHQSNRTRLFFDFTNIQYLVLNNTENACGDAKNVFECLGKSLKNPNASCSKKAVAYMTSLNDYVSVEMKCNFSSKAAADSSSVKTELSATSTAIVSVAAVVIVVCMGAALFIWGKRKSDKQRALKDYLIDSNRPLKCEYNTEHSGPN